MQRALTWKLLDNVWRKLVASASRSFCCWRLRRLVRAAAARRAVLRLALPVLPRTLDPGEGGDMPSLNVAHELYAGLTRFSGRGVVPDLAESWDVERGRPRLGLPPAQGPALERRPPLDGARTSGAPGCGRSRRATALL